MDRSLFDFPLTGHLNKLLLIFFDATEELYALLIFLCIRWQSGIVVDPVENHFVPDQAVLGFEDPVILINVSESSARLLISCRLPHLGTSVTSIRHLLLAIH